MKIYTAKKDNVSAKNIVVDDMILTTDMPTSAGSRMLDGYKSLVGSTAVDKLTAAGYGIGGKADVGEFSFDLLGESSYNGACVSDGKLSFASAEVLLSGDAMATVNLDVNGTVRRAAAQAGLVSVKPTYGTVSRYGTVPVACSGETVSVMANSADACREVLEVINGHDDKDGTSLSQADCEKIKSAKEVRRIAVIKSILNGIDETTKAKIDAFCEEAKKNGFEICEIENEIIPTARVAWNILMSAELCNNVSRYDGVKFGYRAENFSGIDELYTNSRTEAFGELLKTAILFGSETLSTENYMKVYDKALRTRRVIVTEFAKIFESFDAVLMPACSKMAYTEEDVKANKYLCFEENAYTAPASITGLPAVVVGGVQLVGPSFSELSLLCVAEKLDKKGDK